MTISLVPKQILAQYEEEKGLETTEDSNNLKLLIVITRKEHSGFCEES